MTHTDELITGQWLILEGEMRKVQKYYFSLHNYHKIIFFSHLNVVDILSVEAFKPTAVSYLPAEDWHCASMKLF